MTEETIEKMISDWYLSTPRDISELSEQLLEQHEAEMVKFLDWAMNNTDDYFQGTESYRWIVNSHHDISMSTTDLLTLFKNRNK